ncbi:FYDLN acid domain-containing protein [Methylobacterium sp.]|uniref:FYDLN acid domain-containing protein n=1 Tax=Methylobacterium sp. TaxID=409 RepID=UPI003B00A52A
MDRCGSRDYRERLLKAAEATRYQCVARHELGMTRQCPRGGATFDDGARRPVACPRCGAVYLAASRRVAAPPLRRGQPTPRTGIRPGVTPSSVRRLPATTLAV